MGDNELIFQDVLPAVAANGADSTTALGSLPSQQAGATIQFTKCSLLSLAALNGVATNNVTFTFQKVTGGGAPVVIGSLTLALGVNLAAGVEHDVPVSGAASGAPADVIEVLIHQNGTGLAVPAGIEAKIELLTGVAGW